MNTKKAIILDDEIPAINIMESLIVQDGRIDYVEKFSDAELALTYCLENDDINIAFLDIDMPFIKGVDFANRLNEAGKNCLVVFVTAYSEYTKQAYEVNAVGYLNKPLCLEQLSNLLDKFWENPKNDVFDLLTVKTMGQCKVEYDGKKVVFRTKKSQELFFYLLDNEGEYVTTDKLLDVLWNSEYKTTRDLLYSNMHYCRKAFKDVGLNNIIENKLSSYRVNRELIKCDYYDLLDILKKSDLQIDSCEIENIALILNGDYLESFYYDWSVDKNHIVNNRIIKLYNKYKDRYGVKNLELENILDIN